MNAFIRRLRLWQYVEYTGEALCLISAYCVCMWMQQRGESDFVMLSLPTLLLALVITVGPGGTIAFLGVGMILYQRRKLLRRWSENRCFACGYSLQGLPATSVRCPECGEFT